MRQIQNEIHQTDFYANNRLFPPRHRITGAFFVPLSAVSTVFSLCRLTTRQSIEERPCLPFCDHGAQLCRAPSLSCFEKERKDFFNQMANWQQKLSKSITGIKGVDRNIARLTIRIDSLDDFFGTSNPGWCYCCREVHRIPGVQSDLSDGADTRHNRQCGIRRHKDNGRRQTCRCEVSRPSRWSGLIGLLRNNRRNQLLHVTGAATTARQKKQPPSGGINTTLRLSGAQPDDRRKARQPGIRSVIAQPGGGKRAAARCRALPVGRA